MQGPVKNMIDRLYRFVQCLLMNSSHGKLRSPGLRTGFGTLFFQNAVFYRPELNWNYSATIEKCRDFSDSILFRATRLFKKNCAVIVNFISESSC